MIWVAVIGDWFNLIFKWILFGHRPYWWVQETMIYPNQSSPCLEQFPITCETGPGSPSGHAMGSSCIWYVMVTAALSYTVRWKDKSAVTLHRLTWSFLWSIFWIIQISVCISRVFIATHFPHQVILGVFAGILVAEAFEHTPAIQTASLRVYIKTNLFLFIFALGFYLALKLLDIDLLWSVPKAKKWCANPDWINIDTTPFAGLVRNLGALFGLGLGINSEMFIMSCKEQQMKEVDNNEIISAYHLQNVVHAPVLQSSWPETSLFDNCDSLSKMSKLMGLETMKNTDSYDKDFSRVQDALWFVIPYQ